MRNFSDYDIYLFNEGKHYNCYEFMGAHIRSENGRRGVRFTTWAPNAVEIFLVGDFNSWQVSDEYKFEKINEMGIWSFFIHGIKASQRYKFAVKFENGKVLLKADPYARATEFNSNNASVIVNKNRYKWKDLKWVSKRAEYNIKESAINIYEVHLASWKRKSNGDFLTYRELKHILPRYIKEMGYTHVQILPIMEYVFDESCGYQVSGFYSPTSRHGNANGLRELIDEFHRYDIGVILDWTPGRFCKNADGLHYFDGDFAYEYKEEWRNKNNDINVCNFDLGKAEVRSFLISNAFYWLREFHFDGLKIDSVSSMLYLNYEKDISEWRCNFDGSIYNNEAIDFLKILNTKVREEFQGVVLIADESTLWEKVSWDVNDGGLGFGYKLDIGWANDVLDYCSLSQSDKKLNHKKVTFPMTYNYLESFILPISHNNIICKKKSILNRMSGEHNEKFAMLRCLATYMMGYRGKKLVFMGTEFGESEQWCGSNAIDWEALNSSSNKKLQYFFKELNSFYKSNDVLWKYDCLDNSFSWIDANNFEQSIFIFMRRGMDKLNEVLIFVCNFSSASYENFRVGVPFNSEYVEVFNSDEFEYGGFGEKNCKVIKADELSYHTEPFSINIKIPPMATLVLGVKKGEF